MTKEQAIELAKTGWWKTVDAKTIVRFQLFEDLLCMDFGPFHAAVETALGRSVWTHEFASSENLRREFLGDKPAPTMDEIINLIPEAKRILVAV